MLIGINALVTDNRISYDVLDLMIKAELIKNMFIKTRDGYFRPVKCMGELEDLYNMQCEQELEDYSNSIKFAKDDFKRVCKIYKENYQDFKRRYYNRWTGEGLDVCRMKFDELITKDPYGYKVKKLNLDSERSRYKNAKVKLTAEKYRRMYSNIFLFKIEYEQATESYVRELLTKGKGN